MKSSSISSAEPAVDGSPMMAQINRLRFAEPEVESGFLDDHCDRSLPGLRVNMIITIVFNVFWSVADWQLVPEAVWLTWPLRMGVGCAAPLAILWLSYYRNSRRWLFPARMAFTLILNAVVIACTVATGTFGHRHYYAQLLINAFGCSVNPGQRFLPATILIWSSFLAYELTMCLDPACTPQIALSNTIFLVAANLLSMNASYGMERQFRSNFFHRKTIGEQAEALRQALHEVEASRSEADHLSRTDPLTGLYNRRHFYGEASRELGRVSVIILDVDHFKSINDQYGHSTGDQVLMELARRVRTLVRPHDIVCRYGGEEFAILLPGTDLAIAGHVGERIRLKVAAESFDAGPFPFPVTVSVGVASIFGDEETTIEALVDQADQALYEAKHAGRNRVELWNQDSNLVKPA